MASETSWKGATGSWPVPSGEKWSRKDDTLLPSDGWRRAACSRTTAATDRARQRSNARVRSAYACRVVSCCACVLCAVGTEGGDAGYPEDGEARRDEEEEGGDGHHATDLLLRVELKMKKKKKGRA